MTTAPQFSIATPTRNALNLLKRCVGSVRGQKGASYEHLIQDAVSSDGTGEWLSAQTGVDSVSERDNGMYDAINRAWRRSRGQYVAWLNSDEQYLPGTLEYVAKMFDEHPSTDVIWGDVIIVDAQGLPIALRREIPFRNLYVRNSFLYVLSCALFFRRTLLDQGRLTFDPRFRFSGDMDLMLRLGSSGAVIRHVPKYLSLFGNDGGNLSNDSSGVGRELNLVRAAHGGSNSDQVRALVLLARRFERLMIGAYRVKPITYRYAIDEAPAYLEISAPEVGGRYTIGDIRGKAAQVRALGDHPPT
jgi:glycosyltransferase involved in cell wall biosynthesis